MRLMVLGGGSGQLNLIKRAKAGGDFVIVADYLRDCPGSRVADIHVPVSTFDADGVIAAGRAHHIEGLITAGTDQPVLTAALAAEALGLRFYADSRTAKAVTNKRIMKALFTRHAIPTPPYVLLDTDFPDRQAEAVGFPAVLKPVDSQGQRGIFRIEDKADVRRHINSTLGYSREDKALLEAFYKNDEITVNGWVCDGHATILSVVDRVTFSKDQHIGICLCHNHPSVHLGRYGDEIESLTRRIVRAFGIKNGPIYFQYLIGDKGLMVNEVAMRIGGAYEDLTLPLISGIDILGMLFDYTRNGCCNAHALDGYDHRHTGKYISTQLFFCKPGRVAFLTPEAEIKKLPGVHAASYHYHEGSTVPTIKDATARAGYMIIEGGCFDDMTDNVNRVFEALEIRDDQGRNLVIRYQDYPDKYLFYNGI